MRARAILATSLSLFACNLFACSAPQGPDADASSFSATGAVSAGGTTAPETDGDSASATATGDDDLKLDVADADECIECSINIYSKASGALQVDGSNMNIFGSATLMDEVVYALGEHGSGRFIASADRSLPFEEVTDCPVLEWLGGSTDPTILVFGWSPEDQETSELTWLDGTTVEGLNLPDQYIGDPALLKADYDIVTYLESTHHFDGGETPSDAEVQTILDYVNLHGGGVYLVSEWFGFLDMGDVESVNRFMMPMGVEEQGLHLEWGDAEGNIDFNCFPPVG